MSNAHIDNALAQDDEQKLIEQLQTMARTMHSPDQIDLAEVARETKSPRVRNAAALALLSFGIPDTAQLMIELLSRKDTRGARGTLLYVLNELEASVPLDLLVEILTNESYEAQEEALALLQRADADKAARMRALAKLKPLRRSKDQYLSHLASEAIDLLSRQ